MTTSSLLASLHQHPSLPLLFRAAGTVVAPGYHLTEVKRVAYETMDCGGATHRWSETQFELWNPPLSGATPGRAHMPADKFLQIIQRVEAQLPLEGASTARIFARIGDHPAALYDVASVHPHQGQLWIELAPDRTRCKSAERRLASLTGGCCGSGGSDASPSAAATEEGCGCDAAAEPALACCA